MKKFFFFLFFAAVAACKKNDDTSISNAALPEATSSGRNFIAFKADGKVRVFVKKNNITPAGEGIYFKSFDTDIYFSGNSSDTQLDDAISFQIYRNDSIGAGRTISFSDEKKHNAQYEIQSGVPKSYYTLGKAGWVRFSRYDDVVAGTFEFVAYYDGRIPGSPSSDTVHITEGRFDIARY